MHIINYPTVSVDTSAGGTLILTPDQAKEAMEKGMVCVTVNPSVDIVLVNPLGSSPSAGTTGTVANSPWVCPANTPTVIAHRSGVLRAISTSGTATVKVSAGCNP